MPNDKQGVESFDSSEVSFQFPAHLTIQITSKPTLHRELRGFSFKLAMCLLVDAAVMKRKMDINC